MMPKLGDTAFEVETCVSIPLNEFGDSDLDRAVNRRYIVATKDAALEMAKRLLPKDAFGSVVVTPIEFVDPYGDGMPSTFAWEPVGDSLHYSGEETFEEERCVQ